MASKIPPTLRALLLDSSIPGWQISTAFVAVSRTRRAELVLELARMEGIEVHASDQALIMITIEGPDIHFVWETLGKIANLYGVVTAKIDSDMIDDRFTRR